MLAPPAVAPPVDVPADVDVVERLAFMLLFALLPDIPEWFALMLPPAVPVVGERFTFVLFTLVLLPLDPELLDKDPDADTPPELDPPFAPLDKEPDADAPPLELLLDDPPELPPPEDPDIAFA